MRRALLPCALLALAALPAQAERPRIHAITGATLVPAPGEKIESGTIVLRDGRIEAIAADVTVPADATEIDGEGLWVYAGLIDADTGLGLASEGGGGPPGGSGGGSPFGRPQRETPAGTVHPLERVRPEKAASDRLRSFEGDRKRDAERYRDLGFTTVSTAPGSGIFRGSGAVVLLLDDTPVSELILRDGGSMHLAMERGRFGRGYPTSLMGAAATIRQVLLDGRRHAVWNARYEDNPLGMDRPERVAAFDALAPLLSDEQTAFFHVDSPADVLLAARLADEFGLDAVFSASGLEWEIAGRLATDRRTLILPLARPDKPKIDDEDEALDVSIREMRRYVDFPSGPMRLHEAGVRFALTTRGLDSVAGFPKALRAAVEAGLPEDAALAALTTVPAEILGIRAVTGTLEPQKLANLAVFDGPMFDEESKIKSVFVDGVQYKAKEKKKPKGDPDAKVDPRGEWSVVFDFGGRTIERTWTIEGEKDNYTGTAETQSGTVSFDEVVLEGNVMTVTFPAREGRPAFDLTVVITGETFEGTAEMGPRSIPVKGTRTSGPEGGAR